jgi:YidC/Oxa1 family membrane protein insertase
MEKRVVLFLVLSLAIIFGYDYLLKQLGVLPPPDSFVSQLEEQDPGDQEQKDAENRESLDTSSVREEIDHQQNPDLSSPMEAQAIEEKIEIVESPLFHIEITNKGAEIQGWALKKYLTQNTDDPQPVELVYPEGQFAGPLALEIADQDITSLLQEGIYAVERDFEILDDSHPTGHLTYSLRDADKGIWLQKKLTFHHDSYVINVHVSSEGLASDVDVVLGTNFGVVEWGQGFIGSLGPAWMIEDGEATVEKESPDPEFTRVGNIKWAALQGKYFLSVIIPQDATGLKARLETERVVTSSVTFPQGSGTSTHAFQLYAGPKQFDILKSFGLGLEDTIDFGWFIYDSWTVVKAVAKPLYFVLRFFYDYTQNYGLAIILLTCCIKLLFVPLQYKSYKSMQGMQKVQPKVAALQAKYKDDKEKLNKELIQLYKDHKVNPVGGCLPMILQMPAFVSLFNILYMTVDLRQAPFMLWIHDLSIQDPFYVLPVLMGVSMILQQKIMPTTMDPTQAKMMLILPVFMTFLFVTFPAGLVLYWFTNNCLTILQQFVTDRYIFKKPTFTQEAPPPEESTKSSSQSGKKKKGKGSAKDT